MVDERPGDGDGIVHIATSRVLPKAPVVPSWARPLVPEVEAARAEGYVPLQELTGVGETLGLLWPEEDRRWVPALEPPFVAEHPEELEDRWIVRSPWPGLTVRDVIVVVMRWVWRDPRPERQEEIDPRVVEVFGWDEEQALTVLQDR